MCEDYTEGGQRKKRRKLKSVSTKRKKSAGVSYACEKCEFQTSSEGHMKVHIQVKHEGIKQSFSFRKSLVKHKNGQHQHQEHNLAKCIFCEERIGKDSRSWPAHLSHYHLQERDNSLYQEIINRIEIKRFICQVCYTLVTSISLTSSSPASSNLSVFF